MKKIGNYILLLGVALMLASCAKTYKTVYDFEGPQGQGGEACISNCVKTKQQCQKLCLSEDDNCDVAARARAKKNYELYVQRQTEQGKSLINDLNSYYNPLQCEHFMCHCEEDFRACYRLCGGHTHKRNVCIKNCD